MFNVEWSGNSSQIPNRATKESAGYDLYANADVLINAGCTVRVPTGLTSTFTPGWVGLIRDRSSMGAKGISVHGGVIDADYDGEWQVILHNHSDDVYSITAGQKIAQVVFVQYGSCETVVKSRDGGFGSTGK